MPVNPVYIEVPAVIRKGDIPAYAVMRGHYNVTPLSLSGVEHPAGSIRFATFAGSLNKSAGLYHGVYRFEQGHFEGAECAELTRLPGFNSNGEHSDGV